MNLKAVHKCQKLNEALLCIVKQFDVHFVDKQIKYDIHINQFGFREIVIESSCNDKDALINLYDDLSTLLMLFDGYFVPVTEFCIDGQNITEDFLKQRAPFYNSADFMHNLSRRLINFSEVLNEDIIHNNEDIIHKWIELRKELDIIHNMVLYCLSDVKMPKDMQCAFMIESFEGLRELIENEKPEIIFEKAKHDNGHKESQLAKDLISFINYYGKSIFEDEIQCGTEKFAKILVDSRNRIGHIKRNQKNQCLEDSENIIYLLKLSVLYRIVLFDLLQIPNDKYEENLSSQNKVINEWDVTVKFLENLKK